MSRTNRPDRDQMPLRRMLWDTKGHVVVSEHILYPDGTMRRRALEWDTTPAEDASGDVDAQIARLATGTDDAANLDDADLPLLTAAGESGK